MYMLKYVLYLLSYHRRPYSNIQLINNCESVIYINQSVIALFTSLAH